eukprot:1158574-Pelagomonas_calceolata.AAC.8
MSTASASGNARRFVESPEGQRTDAACFFCQRDAVSVGCAQMRHLRGHLLLSTLTSFSKECAEANE